MCCLFIIVLYIRSAFVVYVFAYAHAQDGERGRVHFIAPKNRGSRMERRKRLLLFFVCAATLEICRSKSLFSS